ncbi:cellulose binding domain-containing protein [Allonocardiopsis opalescens]|uniref:Cellulose binding domain-containing protein n=1 Tax=Allonocardiopsis opalescens TaxID=1144618 RepID=A0A2T0PX33_9ACTN|nr:cellulose binding domain-containing protein [Allonocardiopsis opalescens]PRX96094.1 cellulose binding domain-containing protein [Allonocardiopsis opalescens]
MALRPRTTPPPEPPDRVPPSRTRSVRARLTACVAVLATALGALGLFALPQAASATAATGDYEWRNAQVVGGGFVPGIVFNQSEPGLAYARTDIGGAYRWEPGTETWIPLLDWVGWDDWGWSGVASIATDARDPDRVYAAVGNYTNDWDPGNGAILRSDDRGETWDVTELPFKVGGNMPGRGMGERLAVDPNDNRIVYFGAPSGEGLWRSTDYGATWSEVTAFPNPGDYVADPNDTSGYSSDIQGVVWVTFDPTSGSGGQASQDIYVGVADLQNTVYRSTDGGASWERVPGQPTGFIAHKGVLDHENGRLYIATSDTGGPYDGGHGDVWRLDTASGEWTRISPVPSDSPDNHFGYSGLTIDRQDPDTLMVATQISWWPDIIIFRSTDAGATWTRAWDYTSYPNRSFRYQMDISAAPWLTFGANPAPPETTPKLGWMTEALEIDPFDSDRMMYGTGATIYGTENLTTWDSGGQIDIEVMARGLEETAVLDLASPPSGAPLLSGLGDIGGFRHTDLDTVPGMMFTSPVHTSTTSLDYAELDPNRVVRVGNADGVANIGLSNDNGANWYAGAEPAGVTGGGTVALAADGTDIVWSPQGAGVHHSSDFGGSWTPAQGIPAGATVESDRVDPNVFYGYAAGRFYVSTDGGASFTATAATGLPSSGNVRFKAVPGGEGEVWLAGGEEGGTYGLWRSTDAGASFTRVSGVQEADTIGFGAPAPGADHPALYTSAQIGGVRGIFRSDDAGASWVRINDDDNQWAWTGAAITGDPRVYGRVYVGTNGRGVIVGDLADGPGGGDPTGEPTGGPTTGPGGSCSVDYTVTNQWSGGFQGAVELTNTGSAPLSGWSLAWRFTAGERITQIWGATHTQAGADVTVTNASWNATVAPGDTVSFGFLGSRTGAASVPSAFTLNGAACTS